MLTPTDLASFETEPDGGLKVTLQRFGSLRIVLQNGMTIHVMVKRTKAKAWNCALITDLAERDSKEAKALLKGGFTSQAFVLAADGDLVSAPDELEGFADAIGLELAQVEADSLASDSPIETTEETQI